MFLKVSFVIGKGKLVISMWRKYEEPGLFLEI